MEWALAKGSTGRQKKDRPAGLKKDRRGARKKIHRASEKRSTRRQKKDPPSVRKKVDRLASQSDRQASEKGSTERLEKDRQRMPQQNPQHRQRDPPPKKTSSACTRTRPTYRQCETQPSSQKSPACAATYPKKIVSEERP